MTQYNKDGEKKTDGGDSDKAETEPKQDDGIGSKFLLFLLSQHCMANTLLFDTSLSLKKSSASLLHLSIKV